jgi:arginine exporter protein ArgO
VSLVITATTGLLFGLSLVVVIGAQNTYVLRVGMLQQHVLPVVLICTVSAWLSTAGRGCCEWSGGRAQRS